jgi:hypothetical protein
MKFFSKGDNSNPSCGMCRASLNFFDLQNQSPNVLISSLTEKLFPKEYAERVQEDKEEAEDEKNKVYKRIAIGNLHKLIPGEPGTNVHKWTFFVKEANNQPEHALPVEMKDYIEKIVVDLHPTFTPPTLVLTEPPFQFARVCGVCSLD